MVRTLFVTSSGLENAKRLITKYKIGEIKAMTPELWWAKKVVDSTLHPGGCLSTQSTILLSATFRLWERHEGRRGEVENLVEDGG